LLHGRRCRRWLCPTTASDDDDSQLNTAIASAAVIVVATIVAAAIAIAFTAAIASILTLAAAVTVIVISAVAVATATAVAAVATTPSPLPTLSPSLQPPSMSPRLLRSSCQWLVVVSSVAPRLLCCPPSEFVTPVVVQSLTLSPLGRRPLLPTIASRCLVALLPSIDCFRCSHCDGWLLHSPPAQQHTNRIIKLKTFPVPHF
jgi:hypothetical protein